jgi:hypothetical protein
MPWNQSTARNRWIPVGQEIFSLLTTVNHISALMIRRIPERAADPALFHGQHRTGGVEDHILGVGAEQEP